MSLKLTSREVQEITVLDLDGRLVFGKEIDILRNQAKQLVVTDKKKLLLNLDKVSYIDSSGLGCLAGLFVTVRRQGGMMRLVNPNERVWRTLESTKLDTVIEVYDNEQEALASFK